MQKSNVRKLKVVSNAKASSRESLQQTSNTGQCHNINPCENLMQKSNFEQNKLSGNLIQATNIGSCNHTVSNIVPIEDNLLQAEHVAIYPGNLSTVHSKEILMQASRSFLGNTSSNVSCNKLIKYGTSNVVSDTANIINNSLSQAQHISSQISPVIYTINLENNICMPATDSISSAVSKIVPKPNKSLQVTHIDNQASLVNSLMFNEQFNNSEKCKTLTVSYKSKTDNIDAVKTWPFSNCSIPNTLSSDANTSNTPLLQMHIANQISPLIYSPLSNLETEQNKKCIQESNLQCDNITNVMPICNSINSSLLQTGNIISPISPVLYGGSVLDNDPSKVFIQGSQPFSVMQMQNYRNVEDAKPAYYVLVDNNQNIIQK